MGPIESNFIFESLNINVDFVLLDHILAEIPKVKHITLTSLLDSIKQHLIDHAIDDKRFYTTVALICLHLEKYEDTDI